MLEVRVHSARVQDREGIKLLLEPSLTARLPRLCHLWLDAGYTGQDTGAGWVEKNLGFRCRERLPGWPGPRLRGQAAGRWPLRPGTAGEPESPSRDQHVIRPTGNTRNGCRHTK